MPRRTSQLRPAAAALLLSLASLLSCGREITGLGVRGQPAEVLLNPVFPSIRLGGNGQVLGIGEVVDFARVRLVLVRANGDTAVDRLVDFPTDSQSISLRLNVVLGDGATNEGEPFQAAMQYISATGDTVFRAGPATVLARPVGSAPTQPPEIPARYVGPGANAASLTMLPTDFTGTIGQQVTFTTTVRDSAAAVMASVPVAFTSSDSARVRVNLRTGVATLLGARGNALIVGQTLTGQADTAIVSITPSASAMVLVSGGGQQVRQGLAFAQPIRVRVNAADGLGVVGVPVEFVVLSGQGSTSETVVDTDANGIAEVTWTAGDSVGLAQVRATVQGTAIAVTVNGTQLSSSATALTFETQPVNIIAGQALPTFNVVVRDAVADTVRGFSGLVELSLTGGTAGANLVGIRSGEVVNGVASFGGITVDRGGTGYRLVATIPDGPSAQSNTFDAAPTEPEQVTVVSGGGQTVPPATTLPDSVVVRVTDAFSLPKAGVTVNWSVASGGGSTSPATSVTDVNGRAATQWTVGAGGAQELRAQVGQLEPTIIGANIQTGGGAPVLFLPVDQVAVATGRSRNVTVFLTNPTPTPLTVDFVMRSGIATWGAAQLVIPSGGTQLTAVINGLVAGSTTAVVQSAAGTDSMTVLVDTAAALIDLPTQIEIAIGDTVRALVILEEPAPAGGLVVTVQSTDSSRVLVAPGTGLGALERPCAECYQGGLREAGLVLAPDSMQTRLVAPPSGTASITIPEGQLTGVLVVVPIAPADGSTAVPLTLDAPGFISTGTSIIPEAGELTVNCNYCALAVGHYDELWVRISQRVRRDVVVRVASLDPAIATPIDTVFTIWRTDDSSREYIKVAGLTEGLARIVVTAVGFAPDTVTLAVRPTRVTAFLSTFSMQTGVIGDFSVYLGHDDQGSVGYGPPLRTPVSVSLVSRDPEVVTVERSSVEPLPDEPRAVHRLIAGDVGTTWVVYSALGITDSTEVTVVGASLDASSNASSLGVGLVNEFFRVVVGGSYVRAEATEITITSSDPSVVTVLTPTFVVPSDNWYGNARLHARSTGFATLTISSPGFDTITFNVAGVAPSLVLSTFAFGSSIDADSSFISPVGFVATGTQSMPIADSVEVRLRSTNPAALLVTDSLMYVPRGTYFVTSGEARAVGPGVARLVLDAPGFVPDTSAVITVRPLRLFFPTTTVQVGNGLIALTSLSRRTPPSAPLEVALTVSGSTGASVRQAVDTFDIGASSITFEVIGGTTSGIDTLIATAAGLAPDTVFLQTVRATVDLNTASTVPLGVEDPFVGAYLYGPSFANRATDTVKRFLLESRDSSIVRITQDTIEFEAGESYPTRLGALTGVAPGTARVVLTSLDGSVDPDSINIVVGAPRLFTGIDEPMVIGMQQRTFDYELYVERQYGGAAPLWVRLQSSAPDIVQVPDSILILDGDAYALFNATAGDSVGSAQITFTADGHVGGSFQVLVTRARIDLDYYGYVSAFGSRTLNAYLIADGGGTRPTVVDIPLQFTVRDTSLAYVDPDTTTLVAGEWFLGDRRLYGRAAGMTTVSVDDRRAGAFARVLGSSREFTITPPVLRFAAREYVTAPGVSSTYLTYFNGELAPDSLWVRIRTLGGSAAVAQDSVLLQSDDQYGYFDLYGVSLGVDTLVIEAAGWRTDSVIVRVQPGIIRTFTNVPATLASGDSVFVEFELATQGDLGTYALPNAITLTFSTAPNLEVRSEGAVVTTVDLAVSDYRVGVWLRATAPGAATFTVSAPGFANLERRLTVGLPPD